MNIIPWPFVCKAYFESNTSRIKPLICDLQHLQGLRGNYKRDDMGDSAHSTNTCCQILASLSITFFLSIILSSPISRAS